MRRCAHHGRRVCVWCIAQTAAFPLEHLAWERLPLLSWVTRSVFGL